MNAIASFDAALRFQSGGPGFVWTAGLVLAAVAALGVRAWLRSDRRSSILFVELVRFALVVLVLTALAGPEWVRAEVPDEDPIVALLWDDSRSMDTRDVGGGDGARSRREEVQRQLDAAGAVVGRFELVATPTSDAFGDDEARERGTDLAAPLARLLGDDSVRAVVLLSDGDWNEGESPYDVAVRYRLAGVPIFTASVGSPSRLPDVALAPVDPPTFAVVGRPVEIPIAIDSAMPRDVSTTLSLTDESGVVETRSITLPARRGVAETVEYRPTEAGRFTLTVEVEEVEGELDAENNVRTFEIDAREESIEVLLVESVPRWEYRYLRNALARDPGVRVDCYLTHPDLDDVGGGPHYLDAFPTKDELSDYDVVFLGDVGIGEDGLTDEQCGWIAGLVREQASGLILMPGLGGGHLELTATALGDLYPVDLDAGSPNGIGGTARSQLVLTEAGRASSLTRLLPDEGDNARLWGDLPGFQWYAPSVRARAGAQVLAVHRDAETSYGRRPLLVTRTARTGKVLFMGTDGAWRWREGYEDLYHYRFWGQVIRWMAYQRNMNVGESMRLYFAPDRPLARTTIALHANVMDELGAPVEGATVRARVQSPSGDVERLAFEPAASGDEVGSGAWGLYTAAFRPTEGGRHTLALTCEETGATLAAEIPVIARPLEEIGRAARPDVMDEIARLSRGSALDAVEPERLAERLAELPEPAPVVTRVRIWGHPLFGLCAVLLMAALWIGRKVAGRV
ncbi:MAG: hypothetical protein AAGA20_17530 [Planctomycetota bacterium]